MTKKEKGAIMGYLFILLCVIATQGFSAGWNLIKQVLKGIEMAFQFILTMAIRFPDELGITDWLWTRGIFAVIAIGAWLLAGRIFSRKEEKKLLGIISTIVGLISIMLTTV